jgi:hypothetical protein
MIHELRALNQHPQASPHTIHGIAFGSNLTNENKVQMEREKGSYYVHSWHGAMI